MESRSKAYRKGSLRSIKPSIRARWDASDLSDSPEAVEAGEQALHDAGLDDLAWLPSPPGTLAWLPHQCDSWCIGGEQEIKDLIADLQAALEKIQECKEEP